MLKSTITSRQPTKKESDTMNKKSDGLPTPKEKKRKTNKVDKVFELLVETEGNEAEDVVLLIADHIGDKGFALLVHELITTERDDTRLRRSRLEETPDPITNTWRWGWSWWPLFDKRLLLRKLLHPKWSQRREGSVRKRERLNERKREKVKGETYVRKEVLFLLNGEGLAFHLLALILNSRSPFSFFFFLFLCACVTTVQG